MTTTSTLVAASMAATRICGPSWVNSNRTSPDVPLPPRPAVRTSDLEVDPALSVVVVDVVAEADGALPIGPSRDVGGVDRHLVVQRHIEALIGSEGGLHCRQVPAAIVAQQPSGENIDILDTNAAGGVEASVLVKQRLLRRVVLIDVVGIVEVDLAVPHGILGTRLLAEGVLHGLLGRPVDLVRLDLVAVAVEDVDPIVGEVLRIL